MAPTRKHVRAPKAAVVVPRTTSVLPTVVSWQGVVPPSPQAPALLASTHALHMLPADVVRLVGCVEFLTVLRPLQPGVGLS